MTSIHPPSLWFDSIYPPKEPFGKQMPSTSKALFDNQSPGVHRDFYFLQSRELERLKGELFNLIRRKDAA